MAATVFGSSMAGMAMAIIDDVQRVGRECCLEARTDKGYTIASHGVDLHLGGNQGSFSASCCTVRDEIQMACPTAVSSDSPTMPNSLKFTQVDSSKL